MLVDKIPAGKNPPEDLNVIIEVPQRHLPIKYEIDKESGALFVDRFIHTSMSYPCNYGFIPHTLSGDGDPVDVLVVSEFPVAPGAVMRSRPIGVLLMTDESGQDEKILAVPVDKLKPTYSHVKTITDLPEILLKEISHFFEQYKANEAGKWVKVDGFEGVEKAKEMILEGIKRAQG